MKVAVIGAGTMGSGIAQVFAVHGDYEVILCDIKTEFCEKGFAKLCETVNIDFGHKIVCRSEDDDAHGHHDRDDAGRAEHGVPIAGRGVRRRLPD